MRGKPLYFMLLVGLILLVLLVVWATNRVEACDKVSTNVHNCREIITDTIPNCYAGRGLRLQDMTAGAAKMPNTFTTPRGCNGHLQPVEVVPDTLITVRLTKAQYEKLMEMLDGKIEMVYLNNNTKGLTILKSSPGASDE